MVKKLRNALTVAVYVPPKAKTLRVVHSVEKIANDKASPKTFEMLIEEARQLPEIEQRNIRWALQRLIEIASGVLRSKRRPRKHQ